MKGTYYRWHRYSATGEKEIRRFSVDYTPVNELGYTEWQRGTGLITGRALENIRTGVRTACLGKPKSLAHREKMRQAKLGVPKSDEHRANMRLAWARRKQRAQEMEHADS